MEIASPLPALALLPAALALPLIALSRRWPALRESWSVLGSLAQTAIVAATVPAALRGDTLVAPALPLASGVELALRADPLGVFFATTASALWVVTTIYSIGYTRALHEHAQTRYFASFALCLFATVGLAFAGNLLAFFVFFELITISAYPLVVHKGTPEAFRAGRMYLAYTLTAGTALLAAVVVTSRLAGDLDFRPGGILGETAATPPTLWILFALFLVGCGVKAAIMPLHTWLPVAMIAPTPVSALLHAVAVVKAGVFGLARIVGFVFGPSLLRDLGAADALAWIAGATILLGSLAALAQDNLKRLLAFSTVSHLSYVVLGLALTGPQALAGGIFHIASHAVLKITLFFCAGAIYTTTHLERVSELTGIGRRMPVTMTAFTAAAFMLAGLPPGAAFVSKWRLLTGAAEASAWPAVLVLLASTLLNLAYFTPIVVRAFARSAEGGWQEASPAVVVPLVVTAAAGLVIGLAPDGLLSLAEIVAGAVSTRP